LTFHLLFQSLRMPHLKFRSLPPSGRIEALPQPPPLACIGTDAPPFFSLTPEWLMGSIFSAGHDFLAGLRPTLSWLVSFGSPLSAAGFSFRFVSYFLSSFFFSFKSLFVFLYPKSLRFPPFFSLFLLFGRSYGLRRAYIPDFFSPLLLLHVFS